MIKNSSTILGEVDPSYIFINKSLVRIKDMSSGEEKIVNFPTELEKFLEDIAS